MNYAIENISSLPFDHLIGAPLVAGINAQALAAKTTVDFILEVGFQPPSGTSENFELTEGMSQTKAIGAVRTITFSYTTNDNGTEKSASLSVPLLTIVPIPYFAIEEMTIDFMAKITEAVVTEKGNQSSSIASGSTSTKAGWGPFGASLKGSFSSKHSSTSSTKSKYQTELTMNVHVRATQDDMPAGLGKVLEILANIVKEQSRIAPTAPVTPP